MLVVPKGFPVFMTCFRRARGACFGSGTNPPKLSAVVHQGASMMGFLKASKRDICATVAILATIRLSTFRQIIRRRSKKPVAIDRGWTRWGAEARWVCARRVRLHDSAPGIGRRWPCRYRPLPWHLQHAHLCPHRRRRKLVRDRSPLANDLVGRGCLKFLRL